MLTTDTIRTNLTPFEIQAGDAVAFTHGHPDDELATGGAVRAAQAAGAVVLSITATDGEASDRGDPDFLAERGRRTEARAAWLRYDVPDNNQHYLGLDDGRLNSPKVFSRLVTDLAKIFVERRVKHIVTPGDEGFDGHTDHIKVHEASLAANALISKLARRKPASVWGLSGQSEEEVIPSDIDDKLRSLACNRSQFTLSDREEAPGEDWERLGSYWVAPESARLLRPYLTLITSHEAYRRYHMGWRQYAILLAMRYL